MSKTLDLTKQLIAQASVTPEDADCLNIIGQRLEAIGFKLERMPFGEVENLWARKDGDSEGPVFCFAGHTDVVPTGDESAWRFPPFEPTEHEGQLYGRGTADMKGSLAAMVVACEQFVADNPSHKGAISFLLTSDEEGPAVNGTVKVVETLEARNEKIDCCLVGEPSSTKTVGDIIKNGRRGSLGAVLTVKGVQGHVAYPHLADNPIHNIAPALAELAATEWDQGNDFFPATSFQVSNINSGTGATNVIPGTCEVIFNFRFSTELTAEILQERTEAILKKHGVDYQIQWNLSGQPFLTAKGELVEAAQKAIKQVTGFETELSTGGGTSDGRFIAPTGAQVVELGPINATIHQVDEHTDIAELDKLTLMYQHILQELLA